MASFYDVVEVRAVTVAMRSKFKVGFIEEYAAFSMITRPPLSGATVGPEPVTDCLIKKAS
jgi:hypothetical protein